MSAGRARNAGTGMVSTLRRKNRSSRNCPSETRARQIGIGQGNQARCDRDRFGAAQALESALLEHAQELGLRGRRKRRDFIQHDGSRAGHFQPAELALDRAGEGAAFVAEQFRFDEFLRQAGAIDFQEGRIAPRAEFVDQAREMILAGAAFSGDEKRGGSFGDFARELEDRFGGGICRDPGHARRRSRHPASRRGGVSSRGSLNSMRRRRARGARDRKNGARVR